MTGNRNILQSYATLLGTYMGGLWILIFISIPLSFTYSFFGFLGFVLFCTVPFLGYKYARMFRDNACNGQISFLAAFLFMVFMYMFAALLTAVAHYIYFRFFDNGAFINNLASSYDLIFANFSPGDEAIIEQYKEALGVLRSMTPIEMAMQLFSINVVTCSILSLITASFVIKTRPTLTTS